MKLGLPSSVASTSLFPLLGSSRSTRPAYASLRITSQVLGKHFRAYPGGITLGGTVFRAERGRALTIYP